MRRMIPQSLIDWIKSIRKSDNKIDSSKLDKKLYIHPININVANDNSQGGRYTLFIFNNDSSPINTVEKLSSFITDLYSQVGETLRILMNGGKYDSDNSRTLICNFLGYSASGGTGTFYLSGVDTSGYNRVLTSTTLEGVLGTIIQINDGVNQIF